MKLIKGIAPNTARESLSGSINLGIKKMSTGQVGYQGKVIDEGRGQFSDFRSKSPLHKVLHPINKKRNAKTLG